MRMPTLILSAMFLAALSLTAQQAPALKIVVVEGEGGVNIIQQKSAVQPLVEIRDRNNLPVPGAAVTFTIGGNNAAFAAGAHTLTITTNAAGQAAASGLNALSSGAVQIQVSAAYQGQIATAAISQTNFATAAAAAQSAAGAGAGAGGGGGGISGTTIAIAGAAVAGGAIAATQVVNKDEEGGDKNASATYTGSFSGQQIVSTTSASAGGSSTCISTRPVVGTLEITLLNGGGQFGSWKMTGTRSESSVTGPNCTPQPGSVQLNMGGELTGSPSDMTFTTSSTGTGPTPNGGGSVTVTEKTGFKGSLSGNTITGTLVHEQSTSGNNVFNGVSSTITGGGSVSIPITLTHQ